MTLSRADNLTAQESATSPGQLVQGPGRDEEQVGIGRERDSPVSVDPAPSGSRSRTAFQSVLYLDAGDAAEAPREAPAYFRDLNLDQVVAAITAGRDEYDLKPFFHDPLRTVDAVHYRHEVMRDLEDDRLLECIRSFATALRLMREKLVRAGKMYYRYQKERWFLHAVEAYCAAVCMLNENLSNLEVSSRGLRAFRDYLGEYVHSISFAALLTAVERLTADLANVHYCVLIKGNGFKVRKYDAEEDYSAQVAATFEKFRQGAAKDYRVEFPKAVEMNHIEAKILDFVALLYGDIFSALDSFCASNQDYLDPVLARFDREIQFYLSYCDYIAPCKRAGLGFCYPGVSATSKEVQGDAAFDLALAHKLVASDTPVVCNDFHLRDGERVFIISGPNQGGKTTFARTFGQLHYLGAIGCTVPGRASQLFLFDSIFTHFEREETTDNLQGKLQDDLTRIHRMLEDATPRSILIMNEIFNSTTLQDATYLARKVFERVVEIDLLCVCVTFLDEIASLSDTMVSMVSAVVPDDPSQRTYKLVRRPADGRSYAISIAEKYRLTYDWLKTRLPS